MGMGLCRLDSRVIAVAYKGEGPCFFSPLSCAVLVHTGVEAYFVLEKRLGPTVSNGLCLLVNRPYGMYCSPEAHDLLELSTPGHGNVLNYISTCCTSSRSIF